MIPRKRVAFLAHLWASRDSTEEAMESDLVVQDKNVSGEQEFPKSSM